MRFMAMIRADKNTEAGVMPDKQLLADMGKFNEKLVKAGGCWQAKDCTPAPEARASDSRMASVP